MQFNLLVWRAECTEERSTAWWCLGGGIYEEMLLVVHDANSPVSSLRLWTFFNRLNLQQQEPRQQETRDNTRAQGRRGGQRDDGDRVVRGRGAVTYSAGNEVWDMCGRVRVYSGGCQL